MPVTGCSRTARCELHAVRADRAGRRCVVARGSPGEGGGGRRRRRPSRRAGSGPGGGFSGPVVMADTLGRSRAAEPPGQGRFRVGSGQQVPDHGVGQQPARVGEHQPVALDRDQARASTGRAPRRGPASSSTSSGSPSRSRSSSSTRSTRRVSASSTSRAVRRAGPARDPVGVRRGVLDVPPPHAADVGVRARADAPPVGAGPVDEVVPAPARRRRRAQLETSYQPSPAAVSRSSARTYLSARSSSSGIGSSPRRTRRASAVPSSTIREYAETWSGAQASAASRDALPVGQRLPRRAVDQVQADLLEARPTAPRPPRPGTRAGSWVRSSTVQHVVDRRLHPERDPVEAGLAQRDQVGLGDAVRVGLGGHLGTRRQPELGVDRGQHRAEVGRAEQRRRAAAEEDRLDRASGRRAPAGPAGPRRPRRRRTSSARRRARLAVPSSAAV